jgi:nucleotide-binding universal stress UspA family protein
MFERILVPLDGSDLGEMALPWAVEVAAALRSEIDIVGVSETSNEELRNMQRGYLERKAEQAAAQIRSRKPPDAAPQVVRAFLLDGNPAAQLLSHASKNDVGLLILVSHGRSGIMPWPMGSTAARILSRASMPVLFVRARQATEQPASLLGHIMVPLDGSANSESVLPYVEHLVANVPSRVTLFRTIAPGYTVPTIGGLNYIASPKAELDRLGSEARHYLDGVGSRFHLPNLSTEVRVGDAAGEITGFALPNDVTLIAVSSLGTSGGGGWEFGAVTHKVINGGKMPLLLVRAQPVKGAPPV